MNSLLKFLFAFHFIVVTFLTSGQEDFKIISSTDKNVIIEYTPIYLSLDTVIIRNQNYLNIELYNGISINHMSEHISSTQKRLLNIAVPSEYGNSIQIITSESEILKGRILPVSIPREDDATYDTEFSEIRNFGDSQTFDIVTFGEFGKVRDLFVQNIIINPVIYNPLRDELKIHSKIIFQINFSSSLNSLKLNPSDLTSDLVINSNQLKKRTKINKFFKLQSINNSVLATGDWFRFEIPDEGIVKIDATFLTNLGINLGDLDPRTLKIYNNGGYILPWNPNSSRPNDLVEIAIIVKGENDSEFDASDQIHFYGRGVDFWEYNNISDKITRNKHYYSKKNYYWLTFGGQQGKRMGVQESESGTPIYIQNSTKSFKFQDNDNRNLMGSGLLFVDDEYNNANRTQTYIHMLDGLVDGSTINYSFQFVNGSTRSNLLTIEENGTSIFSRAIIGPSTYYQEYRYGALTKSSAKYIGTIPDKRSVLKFSYSSDRISDRGHLDYLEIEYSKNMDKPLNGQPLIFFSDKINGMINYNASPFSDSNFKVYNISQYDATTIVSININGGTFTFNSYETTDSPSKYIAVHNDDLITPIKPTKINNSNIRGYSPGAKYIIISPKEFREQAERLHNYRSNKAVIKTTSYVSFIDEIYNEFSGGSLDPTAIRDFLKYAYENWEIQPEYVLLFGDGDFDYFNTLGKGLNFIPSFQTVESLFEINSYPYDDFYSRISGNDKLADLSVGRLSVTNMEEAKIVVDKIINYESLTNNGLWRNKITLLGDDGLTDDGNDGSIHTRQSENLSKYYIPEHFDQEKIYLSNYQTINTGLGRRKPDCNAAIIDAINNGTLIFNYVGHGNPDVWAHEIVFDRSVSIPQLQNKELFFLTAATCDFGKYDNPNLQSATEEMILMERGGIIGGLSAARPVFSGQNAALNQVFYGYMLGSKDSLGHPIPIGKAYHRLKQQRSSDNDEKFHLFADPLLRLNIPKLPVKITSINDSAMNDTVKIKALSNVMIEGSVFNTDNSNSYFNGEAIITVFDSEKEIYLSDINFNMSDQGGVLFRGRVTVTDGKFSTNFIVPKDISYENRNGRVTAYFYNENIDGIGISSNLVVGGTDSSAINDEKGPEIDIMLDESENSYLVNSDFKLIVKLDDESGLNTSGIGIGHKLEAIINEQIQNSIDLTKFFIGDLNSGGKSGEINYNFSNLPPGEYKIEINAWDIFNNLGTEEEYFSVVDGNKLVIREVYNYPNPISSNTFFTFQHNLNSPLNVKIRVYTIAGRIIKQIESLNIEGKFVKIEWDGKDEDNTKIANGTYLYKLIVETIDGDYKENILGKIAVIR
jgi:hypothetical protein